MDKNPTIAQLRAKAWQLGHSDCKAGLHIDDAALIRRLSEQLQITPLAAVDLIDIYHDGWMQRATR